MPLTSTALSIQLTSVLVYVLASWFPSREALDRWREDFYCRWEKNSRGRLLELMVIEDLSNVPEGVSAEALESYGAVVKAAYDPDFADTVSWFNRELDEDTILRWLELP